MRLPGTLFAALTLLTPVPGSSQPSAPPIVVRGTCDYDARPEDQRRDGFREVFAEDFSRDLGRWTAWETGAFNQELQLYRPSNLAVRGGVLTIEARKEAASGPTDPLNPAIRTFQYTSGRIESRQDFSASGDTPAVRVAARIRLPRGYGMWPAFWTYGDPWPTAGEIDILEARGQDPHGFQTAYWYGRSPGTNEVQRSDVAYRSDVDLTACWHVYEVTWRRDSLTFRFDGELIGSTRAGFVPAMFGRRQRVTLNLAVGGHFFADLDPSRIEPGVMSVDWVRVLTGR
jgi:beta-glucanase (GH16 family)